MNSICNSIQRTKHLNNRFLFLPKLEQYFSKLYMVKLDVNIACSNSTVQVCIATQIGKSKFRYLLQRNDFLSSKIKHL